MDDANINREDTQHWYTLGKFYSKTLERDIQKAQVLFNKAAKALHKNEQAEMLCQLALIYMKSFTQNKDKAIKWFSLAANTGYQPAKLALNELI